MLDIYLYSYFFTINLETYTNKELFFIKIKNIEHFNISNLKYKENYVTYGFKKHNVCNNKNIISNVNLPLILTNITRV